MIPFANPKAQYHSHKDEIDSAILNVLERGHYVLGDEVEAFEKEFASFVGVSYAVGVANGTEALRLALTACDIGSGDEVITVSHTAVATVSAICSTGAAPVFVDIDENDFNIDPDKIEQAVTSRTKAIVPVHIYGQAANMRDILSIARKYDLSVVEDCAQAHGAVSETLDSGNGKGMIKRSGAFGDLGCFSFYPTKNLGAFGDGGMVVTDRFDLAEKLRGLRQYGWKRRYVSDHAGCNSRLDELQAAALRVKLKYLDDDNLKRYNIAKIYNAELSNLNLVLPYSRNEGEHVYHLYVVRSPQRDALSSFLMEREIGVSIHYPVPVHQQPAYAGLAESGGGDLAVTETVAGEILSLPMYPELNDFEVQSVIRAVKSFFCE